MGNRLTKIYTRTGDEGATGLGDGTRVPKASLRVEAMGEVDELNSVIGLLLTYELPEAVGTPLFRIQHELFDLGGELSIPGAVMINDGQVEGLEGVLDGLNADLPPLKEFILPGGSPAAAAAHLARAVCRRAERALVRLARSQAVNRATLAYLNRLSDLLFVMARVLARTQGGGEVYWCRDRIPTKPGQ